MEELSTRTFKNDLKKINNRFSIVTQIYQNKIHTIYKIYDHLIDKFYAAKFLNDQFYVDKNIKLIIEEFKLLVNFNLPSIIRVYEIYHLKDKNLIWYTMELIEGTFDQLMINIYLEQILFTFNKLHQYGLVYNDIKLNNFIFNSDQFTLIDFSNSFYGGVDQQVKENIKLVKFLIQWLNKIFKTDILSSPKIIKKSINKTILQTLLDIFYGKKRELL